MDKVSFFEMEDGTREDYRFLSRLEREYVEKTADRVLAFMARMTSTLEGYHVSRLEHSLQTATRALHDDAGDEMVVAALIHDIGDELAPLNHAEYAAAILKPYVTEKTHWIVEKHGIFQLYYYAHHIGEDRHQRDKYNGHDYYDDTVEFCEKYDQISFDPDYESLRLEDFAPYVKRVFGRRPRNSEAVSTRG